MKELKPSTWFAIAGAVMMFGVACIEEGIKAYLKSNDPPLVVDDGAATHSE